MTELRTILIVFCLLLSAETSYGQEALIDQRNDAAWSIAISMPDSAIDLSNDILKDAKALGYEKGYAQAMAQLGAAQDIKGESEAGQKNLLDAVALQKGLNDIEGLAFSYSNLGFLHYVRGDYAPAAEYFEQCLNHKKTYATADDIAGTKINLGLMSDHLGYATRSENLFKEALADYRSVNDTLGMVTARYNLSTRLLEQKRYKEALEVFKNNEVDLLRLNADPERISSLYYSMTEAYLGLRKPQEALIYAEKNLQICAPAGMIQRRQYAYESLEKVYRFKDDYTTAHRYLKRYSNLRDSLYAAEQAANINALKKDYDLLQASAETEQAKLRQESAQAESRSYRFITFALIALLFLSGGIIYLLAANRKKTARLQSERVMAIEERMSDKELLMGEIHHRVKNNLQLVHSMIEMQSLSTESEVAKSALNSASHRISAIARLHHFLYATDDLKSVVISEYLDSLLDALVSAGENDDNRIKVTTDIASLSLDVETAIPIGLICNELVTNALKHGLKNQSDALLTVSLKEVDHTLLLIISDNGKSATTADIITSGYGTRVVRTLCAQLQATWTTDKHSGYHHLITITNYSKT